MKVFVYTKNAKSEQVACHKDVICIIHDWKNKRIGIIDSDGCNHEYDTSKYKTSAYQNR